MNIVSHLPESDQRGGATVESDGVGKIEAEEFMEGGDISVRGRSGEDEFEEPMDITIQRNESGYSDLQEDAKGEGKFFKFFFKGLR